MKEIRKGLLRLLQASMLAGAAFAASPAFSASDNCPAVNGIDNMQTSSIVSASYSGSPDAASNMVYQYTFSGLDPNNASSNGVPGLITYCVYPQSANLPTGGVQVASSAVGADGTLFAAKMAAKGSFSFTRKFGDPSNIPFDGTQRIMGTATWKASCVYDAGSGATVCTPPSNEKQTILLHINDSSECSKLYGSTGSDTCWVFPTTVTPPPPVLCNGDPICKSAVIDEATGDLDENGYPIVPMNTLLHIHYTYVIVNQPGNSYWMVFKVPTAKTQDINSGGGKDYFGCEQIPDPAGSPGSFPSKPILNYQGTPFTMAFYPSSGVNCSQSRFQVTASQADIVLKPGESKFFTVDMVTRVNKGGKQEFTSVGPHILNSGFTAKWYQTDDNLLHSFTTAVTPLYVDAQPASSAP